jgi:hypothetical protein
MVQQPDMPNSVRAWRQMTDASACTDIHFLDAAKVQSGSDVTREQFDALRILRRRVDASRMTPRHFDDLGIADCSAARALLGGQPAWHRFLDAVVDRHKRATAALGMFALVLKNQRMACCSVEETAQSYNVVLRPRRPAQAAASDEDGGEEGDQDDADDEGCWEYGTATGGSVPFTWLNSDRKVVLREVEGLEQRGAVK